ncbi:formyltetrahydrofolate deformylase [Scopulibacillus darangshiensis]|uniref:Formyltetrahydrofolate deformylase n=1 Tax=Scopulibacillus darangshiensis TaxID=442528 RepID=A0A4R2NU95_9BACL|nr:formyltetrahydrofolate deformylase [Scopulibacillus darangshiensis]TCP24955.1 formyltetrahydrofolate deformylase [Scopulibacillus darangshiensis]
MATHQHTSFLENHKHRVRLLISCQDQPGIVAAVSHFLHENQANIIQSDQYSTDPSGGIFFMRIEFELLEMIEPNKLEEKFKGVAQRFQMDWRFSYANHIKRMGIFVSQQDHCLLELLWHWRSGDIVADIPLVISNHPKLRDDVEALDIPFHYIPIDKTNKQAAEETQLALLKEHNVDFIVLARYMQILSPEFVVHYPNKIINIHHSFLPAFMGARPYERAYERGVKIIGATSHYVTNSLDEGPIIKQGVKEVSHKNNTNELKRIGRITERDVLADAVSLHLEDRVIVYQNKTIVF